MNAVSSHDLYELKGFMEPPSQKFNILQILQKFPKNFVIHEIFKETCIHYQMPILSYEQINQYILSSLERTQTIKYHETLNKMNSNKKLYIAEKAAGQFDYKVCLLLVNNRKQQKQEELEKLSEPKILKSQNNSERLKEKLRQKIDQKMKRVSPKANDKKDLSTFKANNNVSDRIKDMIITPEKISKIYAVTNHYVRQFSINQQKFIGQEIAVWGESVKSASVNKNVIGIMTITNKLYLQVDPLMLKATSNESNRRMKISAVQIKLAEFDESEDFVYFESLSQESWALCSKTKVFIIRYILSQQSQFKPQLQKKIIFNPEAHQTTEIIKVVQAHNKFLILCTSEESLYILNTQSMKITNKIYNDVNYDNICFNKSCNLIIVSDFAGYLIIMGFNSEFGDTQEEGISGKNKIEKNHRIQKNQEKLRENTTIKYLKAEKESQNYNKINVQSSDVPLAKEVRTIFTKVVRNSHARTIDIVKSKEKSIFTYQSLGERMIKIWDISTLRVYQKIKLSLNVSDLEITHDALFLLSADKGYLSYYKFEKQDINSKGQTSFMITDVQVDRNNLLIKVSDVKETGFYHLKMSNHPQIHKLQLVFPSNSIKFAYYKDQVSLLNTSNPDKHKFRVYGGFGENIAQEDKGYNDYHSLVKLQQGRVLLYGPNIVTIQGKKKHRNIYNMKKEKKGMIYSNIIDEKNNEQGYKDHIIFKKLTITSISYFQGYLLLKIQEPSQNLLKKIVYVINEKMLTISTCIKNIPKHIKIICAHKLYLLINKKSNEQNSFELYSVLLNKIIWKSEDKYNWSIEQTKFLAINKNNVKIAIIYRSKLLKPIKQYPIYTLSLIQISCQHHSSQQFIDVTVPFSQTDPLIDKNFEEIYTFDEILNRSIASKVNFQNYDRKQYQKFSVQSKSVQIFIPDYCEALVQNMTEGQISRIQGKIIQYEEKNNFIGFYLAIHGMLTIYNASDSPRAIPIGLLDFNNKKQKNEGQEIIVDWNDDYKSDQKNIWEKTLKDAGRYLTKKKSVKIQSIKIPQNLLKDNPQDEFQIPQSPSSPFKFRRLKTEDQNLNRNIEEFNLNIIAAQKQKAQTNQSKKQMTSKSINNILYRQYIQKNIKVKNQEEQKLLEKKKGSTKSLKKITYESIEKIQALTESVKKGKVISLSNQTLSDFTKAQNFQEALITTSKKIEYTPATKASSAEKTIMKKSFSSTDMKKIVSKKLKYGKNAQQQLEMSKNMQKLMLPEIEKYRINTVACEDIHKDTIYKRLKKQTMPLKQSRIYKF